MMRKRVRDVITGLFVKRAEAELRPGSTVTETVSTDAQQIAALKWRLTACQAVMREAAGDLDVVLRDSPGSPAELAEIALRLRDGAQAADG